MSKLNEQGWEIPDQTPVAIPAYIKHYDQRDSIREMIRAELSKEAQNAGYETFEEADDFDVGDDYDPTSPYEEEFDPKTGYSLWETAVSSEAPDNQEQDKAASPENIGSNGTTGVDPGGNEPV